MLLSEIAAMTSIPRRSTSSFPLPLRPFTARCCCRPLRCRYSRLLRVPFSVQPLMHRPLPCSPSGWVVRLADRGSAETHFRLPPRRFRRRLDFERCRFRRDFVLADVIPPPPPVIIVLASS